MSARCYNNQVEQQALHNIFEPWLLWKCNISFLCCKLHHFSGSIGYKGRGESWCEVGDVPRQVHCPRLSRFPSQFHFKNVEKIQFKSYDFKRSKIWFTDIDASTRVLDIFIIIIRISRIIILAHKGITMSPTFFYIHINNNSGLKLDIISKNAGTIFYYVRVRKNIPWKLAYMYILNNSALNSG